MSSDSVTSWSTIAALILSVVTVAFNAIQLLRFRTELRHQTDMAVYGFAFEWDRFLAENPRLAELLQHPSPQPTLTTEERLVAEYRLDLAELTASKHAGRLYRAEPDFFDRLIRIPLIQKAIRSGEVDSSVKTAFLAQCKAALERQTGRSG
jgi:hypothetical protein